MVKMWYYGITTLSTIGYGDFSPKSSPEKLVISFVMMIGVAIFSYIMGNFMEILMNYKKIDSVGDPRQLTKWIALLTKYNESKPMPKSLITKIEDFFIFYWNNSPLMFLNTSADLRFIAELPETTVQSIYIDYLFNEFIYKYDSYFRYKINDKNVPLSNFKYRRFLVTFLN
jgi:hypothetical protein